MKQIWNLFLLLLKSIGIFSVECGAVSEEMNVMQKGVLGFTGIKTPEIIIIPVDAMLKHKQQFL